MRPQTHRSALGALPLLLFLSLPPAAVGQVEAELEERLGELARGQQEIRRQIEEIKRLLQARPAGRAPAPARPQVKDRVFDLGANPVRGEGTARLTLVDFTDYQ